MKIQVGPERRTFSIHKAMLTESAKYFKSMFEGAFVEAAEASAEIPEHDPDAWELLIEWAYKGELQSLGRPTAEYQFDEIVTETCWKRLKFCCLAEKYGMLLLHNMAIDSINSFLKHGGPGPKLTIEVFRKWTKYVFENTGDPNNTLRGGLRNFIKVYFLFSLGYTHSQCKPRNPRSYQHGADDLADLAGETPDLLKYVFCGIRHKFLKMAPWNHYQCNFHVHTDDSMFELHCAENMNISLDRIDDESRIHYVIQDLSLKGSRVIGIGSVVDELGMELKRAQFFMNRLILEKVVIWVEPNHTVRLVPPKRKD